MPLSCVLGLDMHLFCIKAGTASSRKCAHLSISFVLRSTPMCRAVLPRGVGECQTENH